MPTPTTSSEQAARRADDFRREASGSSGLTENRNTLTDLPPSEDQILEAAREAWVYLKKRTFEQYLTIGEGIMVLRARADRLGGRKTFAGLMAEQGFKIDGPKAERTFNKVTASNLERVMKHKAEVIAWHEKLAPAKQAEWASPTAILRHCPVFTGPKNPDANPPAIKPSAQDQIRQLVEDNALLVRAGDDLIPPETTAAELTRVLASRLLRFTPSKATEAMRNLPTVYAELAAKRGDVEPRPVRRKKKRRDADDFARDMQAKRAGGFKPLI
jgi:hypothetical protein